MSAEKSRARFFAQFILSGQSEILRCAQDDSEGREDWDVPTQDREPLVGTE
ncbi:MAG: hypothetical protein WCD04_16160 [Terriglobia bacterium]|jgi:hypothetical protein